MNVGFIGLGKLGMPVALGMSIKGHNVVGYDVNPDIQRYKDNYPHMEEGYGGKDFKTLLKESSLSFGSIPDIVKQDIIFIAVQTPHGPEYEGISPLPPTRKDFNYTYLFSALADVENAARAYNTRPIVCVISTVLPGTVSRRPYSLPLVYNPYFIAMGTTLRDFFHPEFILTGSDDEKALDVIEDFYKSITYTQVVKTAIANAELIKVAYNTIIGSKIIVANTLMEICDRMGLGMDVDEITSALKLATDRLVSPRYMDAGMGDGGACHPRDNIAMSYLAQSLNMKYDLFGDIMRIRESQAEYLCDILCRSSLPKVILGYTYKPNTNLTYGSAAILCCSIMAHRGHNIEMYDPVENPSYMSEFLKDGQPRAILIGCKHKMFNDIRYPAGTFIVDPFRYIEPQEGVIIHRVGNV